MGKNAVWLSVFFTDICGAGVFDLFQIPQHHAFQHVLALSTPCSHSRGYRAVQHAPCRIKLRPVRVCRWSIAAGIWWTWRGSNPEQLLIIRNLLIPRKGKTAQYGQNASLRYTAGTRAIRPRTTITVLNCTKPGVHPHTPLTHHGTPVDNQGNGE